jgi:predicted secreted hydrolase
MIMRHFERGLHATPDIAASTSGAPVPIPASKSAIFLPADQYLHRGAPTEWWWHVGTLQSGDRIFGFEINAAAFSDRGYAFSQVMLTDVANAKHYQRTTLYTPPVGVDFDNWAQHDVTKDWHVGLGSACNCLSAIEVTNPGSGYSATPVISISGGGGTQGQAYATVLDGKIVAIAVSNPGRGYTSAPKITITDRTGTGATAQAVHSYVTMDAPWGDPTKGMAVVALLMDQASNTEIYFDLMLSQQGPPFIVWGTGVGAILLPPSRGTHLQTNNYYYSLTRLAASGSITIGGEKFAVSGRTWMDHEYGYFGTSAKPVKWVLQDAQLDNGWTLSNFAVLGDGPPKLNQPTPSLVTLQDLAGAMYFQIALLTPVGNTWTSPASGITYFMQFKIDIPAFAASLNISSLVDAQEFPSGKGAGVYEGVAAATGTFAGKPVSGTAWNEQAL